MSNADVNVDAVNWGMRRIAPSTATCGGTMAPGATLVFFPQSDAHHGSYLLPFAMNQDHIPHVIAHHKEIIHKIQRVRLRSTDRYSEFGTTKVFQEIRLGGLGGKIGDLQASG